MDGARRHVTLMVIPLAVIALGLFASVGVPYGHPLKWLAVATPLGDLSPFHVIYVGAGLVAGAIVLAARHDSPPGRIATVIALLAIVAPTIMTAIAVKVLSDGGYWTHVLVFAAPIAISLVLAFNALRARGWDRMLLLLGAFSIAALPYSCPLVPGIFNLFSGGLVYLAADLTVLVLFIRGLRR
ncbi:hypothetical protein BH11MYX3_BH11MYX3_28220 [soil metagenome]